MFNTKAIIPLQFHSSQTFSTLSLLRVVNFLAMKKRWLGKKVPSLFTTFDLIRWLRRMKETFQVWTIIRYRRLIFMFSHWRWWLIKNLWPLNQKKSLSINALRWREKYVDKGQKCFRNFCFSNFWVNVDFDWDCGEMNRLEDTKVYFIYHQTMQLFEWIWILIGAWLIRNFAHLLHKIAVVTRDRKYGKSVLNNIKKHFVEMKILN